MSWYNFLQYILHYRFLIVGEKNLYESLVKSIEDWPTNYKDKLRFEYIPVWYPEGRMELKHLFRVCASERLLLPLMLPAEDAVIYLDTDLIFMTPPNKLWDQFHLFDSEQFTAIAPVHSSQIPVKNVRT